MFNIFFGDIGNSIRMEANSLFHIPNTENSTVAAATNLDSRKKNDEFEGLNLSKAKTSTFRRAKKQRTFLSSKDAKATKREKFIKKQKDYFKDMDALSQRILAYKDAMKKNHKLQEYIKKHTAYLKEIDEFELEVESSDELDHPPYFKKKVDKVELEVESDEVGDHQLHDAYSKESDEFELEVESGHELDHQLLDHELDHQLQEYIKKHNVLLWT